VISNHLKTTLALIVFTGFAHLTAHSQVEHLTINGVYQDEKTGKILKDIESRYALSFFYKDEWLKDKDTTISFNNEPIISALEQLCKPQGLTFLIYNEHIIIIARTEDLEKEFTQNYYINRRLQEHFLQTQANSGSGDIVFLGDSNNTSQASEAFIRGVVIDGRTGDPLSNVNVRIESINKSITTNPQGKFSIQLPTGSHQVSFSYVGFEAKTFSVRLSGDDDWKVEIFPESVQLGEVLINGTTEGSGVQSMVAGITKLTSRDIRDLPVFLGEADVIKTILTMPGVSTTGEGTSGFHVRGGNVDQNLILQDEAVIFNSSHALGFFSVFNPDIVKEVNLYKGHIPAQYGGRIASVLDVKLKDFNNDRLELNGGIGFVTSRASLNAPLFNKKTSILIGGRITYSDWILKQIKVPSVQNSSASFYDYNIKLDQKMGKNGMLTASASQSYDRFQFTDEFGFAWKNKSYSLAWNQVFKQYFSNNLVMIYGEQANEYYKPNGIDAYQLSNGLSYIKVKEELFISKFRNHSLITGVEGTKYNMFPDRVDPYNDKSYTKSKTAQRENGLEMAGFINDEYVINHLFSVAAGLRFNAFQSLGPATIYQYAPGQPMTPATITDSTVYGANEKTSSYHNLEPRISFKYAPDPVSAFKISYNRLNQFIHLISNTVAPIPVDMWQVSNSFLKPQGANNFSIGYFRTLRGNMFETSLDVYYRSTSNIPLYKDFADIRLNEHLETEIIAAQGKSYGIEFYLRKFRGKYSGWISYTYSRSMFKTDTKYPETTINRGEWFPTHYDKPHQLNIVLDINFTKASILSFNFTYYSGRPITAPTSNYYYNYFRIPDFAGRNDYTIPDYHRLDISYTLKRNIFRNHRYQDGLTFSVYNLYSRDNAFSVFFRRENGSNANAYKLSVLGNAFPSVTYNFSF
jgi:hypothetical protein